MNFMKKYKEELDKETDQFLFLCGKRDVKILIAENGSVDINEHVRLACIALVFGYKKFFLKIVALSEKHFDDFLKELKSVDGNFFIIEEWVNEFIANMAYPEAQDLARELWQARKDTLNCNDFKIGQLMDN